MSKKEIPDGLSPEEELAWIRARRVKYAKKNDERYDKVYVRLPRGTADRIKALGYVPATFIKKITLDNLNRIEELEQLLNKR